MSEYFNKHIFASISNPIDNISQPDVTSFATAYCLKYKFNSNGAADSFMSAIKTFLIYNDSIRTSTLVRKIYQYMEFGIGQKSWYIFHVVANSATQSENQRTSRQNSV